MTETKRMIIRDTETADILWSSVSMPLPEANAVHELITVAFVYANQNAFYEYRIDAIDPVHRVVYVTLERVYVNGFAVSIS